MKKSTEMLLVVGGSLFLRHQYNEICKEADKYAMKAAEKAAKSSVDATNLDIANERLAEYNDILKTTDKLIDDSFGNLINMDGINELRKNAEKEFDEGLAQFKKTIDYEGQMAKFGEEKIKAINEGLNEIDYNSELRSLTDAINELEDQLDNFDDVLDDLSDDVLDDGDISSIRRVYERTIKDKMKRFEKEKSDLIKQKDEIVKAASKDYDRNVKALNDEVAENKKQLVDILKKKRAELDKEVSDAKKQAHDYVYDELLTDEQKAVLKKGDAIKADVKNFKDKNAANTKDIYGKMSKTEKLAEYARLKGKTKTDVMLIAATPAIPVGYVGYKYVKFVKDILEKM